MGKNELTPKQSLFCKEFLIDLNATQAAIRAGYSKRSARQIAQENLSKPDIQKEIEKLMTEREKRTEHNGDEVIRRLWEIVQRCMQKVPVLDKDGNETGKYRFDAANVNRALELLGKHYKLFTEKIERTGSIDVRYEEAEAAADAAIEALLND